MSRDRKLTPELQKPFTASIQVKFPLEPAAPQSDSYSGAVAPSPVDAEVHYQRGGELRGQKRLDDALLSFERAIALKPDYAEAHNGRGITLASLERLDAALLSFERAIALKPDYAEAYNNRALILQDLKRHAEALASFDSALALKPGEARIYNNRADTLRELGRPDEALASYDKAIALQPDYAAAHFSRGTLLQGLDRLDDAVASFDTAIALKPDYADAYNNRGVVLQDLRRLDAAAADFSKASALQPQSAASRCNQAYCTLLQGDFEQGWRLHEWRKATETPVGNRSFRQPLWLGQDDIAGKTIFLHWEQGFGDTLQFFRYAEQLQARGAKVAMSVQQPLYRLFTQLRPAIAILNQDEVPAEFDYHCPLMSLPLALAATLPTIPAQQRYLSGDDRQRQAWRARLPQTAKPRIGVVWSGNSQQKNDRNRSIDLATLAPLFSFDAQWITLQKELRAGDAARLAQLPQVVSSGEALTDFADTAALIDLLDLVITVDTSVAHLAGAMGKPVWLLLAYNSDWRWLLHRDDSPWYPSVRLFRQQRAKAWGDVVTRLEAALRDVVPSHARLEQSNRDQEVP